jgi:hypothetical protein
VRNTANQDGKLVRPFKLNRYKTTKELISNHCHSRDKLEVLFIVDSKVQKEATHLLNYS